MLESITGKIMRGEKTKIIFSIFLFIISLFFCHQVLAELYDYDLGFSEKDDFSFSVDELIVGERVRLYARVHNLGRYDVSGYVSFIQGSLPIGYSQPISVRANGFSDEVFVDFTIPSGAFNINAKIEGVEPEDKNLTNNQLISSLYYPKIDSDQDKIPDDRDNDDDNDGLTDEEEAILGTNPLKSDTDGDSVNDKMDKYPLDANKWEDPLVVVPETKPEPKKETPKAEVVQKEEIKTQNNDQKIVDNAGEENSKVVVDQKENSPTTTTIDDEKKEITTEPITIDSQIKTTENFVSWTKTLDIVVKKNNWNDFVFSSNLSQEILDKVKISWMVDEKNVATGDHFIHIFNGGGNHQIKMSVVDENNSMIEKQTTIKISFFNIHNKKIWLVVGGMVVLIVVLMFFGKKTNKKKALVNVIDDQRESKEEDEKEEVIEEEDGAEEEDEEESDDENNSNGSKSEDFNFLAKKQKKGNKKDKDDDLNDLEWFFDEEEG